MSNSPAYLLTPGDKIRHTSYQTQHRIDIAFALAQSALIGQRGRSPVDWLIVDEGWGSLDTAGIEALKDTFTGLQQRYSLLLVITHVDAVAECLPQQIRVTGHHDGSRLEVLG